MEKKTGVTPRHLPDCKFVVVVVVVVVFRIAQLRTI